MDNRVQNYWTHRAHDFASVRRNELESDMGVRWLAALKAHLPQEGTLDILDVGTGTGFFPVLLAGEGHRVCGIDLTTAMLEEARALNREKGLDISFLEMDAQKLSFPDASFDAVLSRNLTWTLPDPEQAYKEWLRVLRPGGILLNFDANYGQQIIREDDQNAHVSANSPYGHVGMTEELARENAEITMSMPVSRVKRPEWDERLLRRLGESRISVDLDIGKKILNELDLEVAPMFMVKVVKHS